MDDQNRRRRQNDAPMHPTSDPRYARNDSRQPPRWFGAANRSDSYQPAALSTSPTAGARSMSGSAAGYSPYFGEQAAGAFPTAAMSYHQPPAADYGQDARQTQALTGAYNTASMMYNAQAPVYDTSAQPFNARPSAALQIVSPDVSSPYFQGEPAAAAAAAAATAMQSQAASSSASPAVYRQQGYSTAGMASMGGLTAQSSAGGSGAADVAMEEQEYGEGTAATLEEAYALYQTTLREIFQKIGSGNLKSASDELLRISDWLLSHVTDLGLTSDDASLHEERLTLWTNFNYAWLSLLQQQKDMMESGSRSQGLISQEGLEKLGRDIVRLCDSVERHGLVDYQYGVWEEQIIAILTECVDLYEAGRDSAGPATASSSRRR